MSTRANSVGAGHPRMCELEALYRREVGAITAFFARRWGDPQMVADLTAETFAQAISSYDSFDPSRGSPRGWLFGIAQHVLAQESARTTGARDARARLARQRMLADDEMNELAAKIDDEREARDLLKAAVLSPAQRRAIELVDIAGLTPHEAATALGVSSGVLRGRLFRARVQLRRQGAKR
jgi:RNA polymerase sigma factor (sigma-70 family)